MAAVKIGKSSSVEVIVNDFTYILSRFKGPPSFKEELTIQAKDQLDDKFKILEVKIYSDHGHYLESLQTVNVTLFQANSTAELGSYEDYTYLCINLAEFSSALGICKLPKRYLDYKSSFIDDFSQLLNDETHKDVTFKVGESKINAHKLVLSTRSSVLNNMLTIDMEEKRSGVIEIEDASFEAFSAFLEFIYGEKYERGDMADESELLYLADKYNVQNLKIKAANTLLEMLDENNAIEILILFDRHQIYGSKKEAAKFIAVNHETVFNSEVKLKLKQNHSDLVELIETIMHVMN